MIKLITKVAMCSLLLNAANAGSQVVLNLPEPPAECQLLADATCVYDASTGKYTIVGDNSEVVINLPEPPEECKLLADATCVYDASTGKYTIVGDNSEIDANGYAPQPQNEEGQNFDSIKSKIIASLEKKLIETVKLKDCTLAADNMKDLKECKTKEIKKEETQSSNSKFDLRKNKKIKSIDKKIKRIDQRIDKIKKYSKLPEEIQKTVLFRLNMSIKDAVYQKTCISGSSNYAELKSCRYSKQK